GVGRWQRARGGVFPPASTDNAWTCNASPHEHLAARPHGRVAKSCTRCTVRAEWRPGIGRGIVARTCVEHARAVGPTPYDHFRPGPYGRVAIARPRCRVIRLPTS